MLYKLIKNLLIVILCVLALSQSETVKAEGIQTKQMFTMDNLIVSLDYLVVEVETPELPTENNNIPVYSVDSVSEITIEEFDLLANLVMSETESQDWYAQYLVACVILNRLDSDLFPDTIEEIIHQDKPTKQFSPMWNGRFEKVVENGGYNDSVAEAVQSALELNELKDTNVFYFTSCGYLSDTKPYSIVDDMYFSSQKK